MPELRDLPRDRCPPALSRGDDWLRDRLEEASISYHSDDGAGYVVAEAGARVWVTGVMEDGDLLESAYRQTMPFFAEDDVTVFARPTWGDISFLYWRAGGVDTSVECDVSLGDVPRSLKQSISDLIRAQRRHPYE
ncbi:MAG: hypothetical protein M3323_15600 [Actinomycetota bacterium]|nr:hypothetical protein [Actinomycetota bacterium]